MPAGYWGRARQRPNRPATLLCRSLALSLSLAARPPARGSREQSARSVSALLPPPPPLCTPAIFTIDGWLKTICYRRRQLSSRVSRPGLDFCPAAAADWRAPNGGGRAGHAPSSLTIMESSLTFG